MNSIIIKKENHLNESEFIIQNEKDYEHLISHLKIAQDDILQATLIGTGLVKVLVREITPKNIILQKSGEIIKNVYPEIRLVVGLSRPPTMKKIIEHGSSLGVSEFIFYHSQLSEKSYAKSKVLKPQSIEELIKLGLSQSAFYHTWPTFQILNSLSELDPNGYLNIVLDREESEGKILSKIKASQKISLTLGAERGFTERELQLLKNDLRHSGLSISKSTLRVEIAAFCALGAIAASD